MNNFIVTFFAFSLPKLFNRLFFNKDEEKPKPIIFFSILGEWYPTLSVAFMTSTLPHGIAYFALEHLSLSCVLILIIGVAPNAAAILEGTIYGTYCNLKHLPISWEQISRYSEKGARSDGSDGMIYLSFPHHWFWLILNVGGSLCTVFLLIFASSYPEFKDFLRVNDFNKYMSLLLPACVSLTLLTPRKEQSKIDVQNKFNFYLSRPHVILDVIRMSFQTFLCIVLVLTLVAFSVVNTPYLSLWAVLPLMSALCFIYSFTVSKQAREFAPENIRLFFNFSLILMGFVNIWIFLFFKNSAVEKIIVLTISLVWLLGEYFLRRRWNKKGIIKLPPPDASKWAAIILVLLVIVCAFIYRVVV